MRNNPRVVMEEDCFWVAPLEIQDFITAGLPSLLEELAPYIFGVLLGNLTAEDAIGYIKQNILGEKTEE